MTTFEAATEETPAPPVERVPRFGAATPAVAIVGIAVVSVVSWWLLGDAQWSLTNAFAPVVSCLLFWTIFGFIITGFTFGSWPFTLMAQPAAGVAHVVSNVAFGIVMTLLFTRGVGHWDPTFSAATAGGAGYTATAFIVLVAFYVFAVAAASWGGYPFETIGTPLGNVAQLFMASFITVAGVVLLVYPNFSAQLAAHPPVSLPTALGWTYSSIVVAIVASMQWANWPWAGIGNRHLRALTAVVVTIGGGYLLFLALRGVADLVVPGTVRHLATFSSSVEAAEIGVCFSLWSLIVGLVVPPAGPSANVLTSRAVRTVAVAVLAVVTYVVFMRFVATSVLHFPAIDGAHYGGDPLAFMDWTILVVLWHAFAFGGFWTTKRAR